MLKPPVQVLVAYGHNHGLRDEVADALERIAKRLGYRIRVRVVTDSIVRTGTGGVESSVHEALRSVDAAIVLLTADDYAISKSDFAKITGSSTELFADELQRRMELRGRQNVVYEIGFLNAKIGKERYYIIADDDIKPFANLGDTFRTQNVRGNVDSLITEFLKERLKLKQEKRPLYDSSFRIEYHDFIEELQNLDDTEVLEDFEKEFSELTSDDDRVLYLYERIVFDSYFQTSAWWQRQIARIKSRDVNLQVLVSGLSLVQEYMAKWRPPELKDYAGIRLVADELRSVAEKIEKMKVAPVVRMVIYDYIGLSLDKCGRRAHEQNKTDEALGFWTEASAAFDQVVTLSVENEDDRLPLWRGYAAYNKARVLRQMSEISSDVKEDWMAVFQQAIRVRHKWTQTSVFLPNMVKEGLYTEYLHAKAARIQMKGSAESGDFAIDERYISEAMAEFKDWLSGPNQNRVRLAKNVIETWSAIESTK